MFIHCLNFPESTLSTPPPFLLQGGVRNDEVHTVLQFMGILNTLFIQIPDFQWLMLGGGGRYFLQEHLDNAVGLLIPIKSPMVVILFEKCTIFQLF